MSRSRNFNGFDLAGESGLAAVVAFAVGTAGGVVTPVGSTTAVAAVMAAISGDTPAVCTGAGRTAGRPAGLKNAVASPDANSAAVLPDLFLRVEDAPFDRRNSVKAPFPPDAAT